MKEVYFVNYPNGARRIKLCEFNGQFHKTNGPAIVHFYPNGNYKTKM